MQGATAQAEICRFDRSIAAVNAEFSSSLILKTVIYSLREILNISAAAEDTLEPSNWLDPDAAMLTSDYEMFGLYPGLTSQQVSAGLDDCDEAIDLIDGSASELELSEATRISLRQTIQDIRSELLDAQ